MPKVQMTTLANLDNPTQATSVINQNFAKLQAIIDLLLSRDGASPNTMAANLDMNNYRIINLPNPTSDTEPARAGDLLTYTAAAADSAEEAAASADAAADSATEASASATVASNFDSVAITVYIEGLMNDSEKLYRFASPYTYTLRATDTSLFRSSSAEAAADTMVVTFYKNASSIGTLTYGEGELVGVFSFSSDVSFAVGDVLEIRAPSSADETLQGLTVTILVHKDLD